MSGGRVDIAIPALAQVFVGAGHRHEQLAVPQTVLGPHDLLAEIELATICGSDVHTTLGARHTETPLVLGHEYVGRIVALGAGGVRTVDGEPLALGQRIVWSLIVSCGSCERCVLGLSEKCRHLAKYGHAAIEPRWELSGGFATHMHVREGSAIVRVREELPATVLAPASCGTATAAAALDRAATIRPLDGATVLVTGAGLIGLTASAMAREAGARVIVSDPDADRRALAGSFGATGVGVAPADIQAAAGDAEIDIVIEASGSAAAIRTAVDLVGVGGVIVLVGSVFPAPPVPLDAEGIVRRLVTIRGVHNYSPRDLRRGIEFLTVASGRYPFAALVGEVFALSQLDEAIVAAQNGRSVRVGVDPLR